jgi:CBS domain-containing protein
LRQDEASDRAVPLGASGVFFRQSTWKQCELAARIFPAGLSCGWYDVGLSLVESSHVAGARSAAGAATNKRRCQMYEVKDAMSPEVISIRPDATIDEAIRTLLHHNITGAPVMDNGQLCGIISQFQLLEVIYEPLVKTKRVQDLMTRKVLTVEEDDLLGIAANMFVVHRIHRLPVMRDGQVIGIISRSDLLRYIVNKGEKIDSFFEELRAVPATPTEPMICA